MATSIVIKDETAAGKVTNEISLSFDTELITVKEIIQARVRAEVELYNKRLPEYYKGLVQPLDAETTLNGYKMRTSRQIDPEKQSFAALDAFSKNGYFVLIDNIQAESLDQMVVINSTTAISFVKLTPLVGG